MKTQHNQPFTMGLLCKAVLKHDNSNISKQHCIDVGFSDLSSSVLCWLGDGRASGLYKTCTAYSKGSLLEQVKTKKEVAIPQSLGIQLLKTEVVVVGK